MVWFLTGVWHGANWTFITWGLMYFVLLSIEKLTVFGKLLEKAKVFNWIYTILFVVCGWVLFRANSITDALIYLKSMFGFNYNVFCDETFKQFFLQIFVYLVFGILFSFPFIAKVSKKIKKYSLFYDVTYIIVMIVLLVASVSNIVSDSYNPFIYFNF